MAGKEDLNVLIVYVINLAVEASCECVIFVEGEWDTGITVGVSLG